VLSICCCHKLKQVDVTALNALFGESSAPFVDVVKSAMERVRQSSMFSNGKHPVAVLINRLRDQVRYLQRAQSKGFNRRRQTGAAARERMVEEKGGGWYPVMRFTIFTFRLQVLRQGVLPCVWVCVDISQQPKASVRSERCRSGPSMFCILFSLRMPCDGMCACESVGRALVSRCPEPYACPPYGHVKVEY
jgi:hypothetical protein